MKDFIVFAPVKAQKSWVVKANSKAEAIRKVNAEEPSDDVEDCDFEVTWSGKASFAEEDVVNNA